MVDFKDTEGATLPVDKETKDTVEITFDINLWGDGSLVVGIPWDDVDLGDQYYAESGQHVLITSLREVLQEYLENFDFMDEKHDTESMINLLHEYSEKIRVAKDKINEGD